MSKLHDMKTGVVATVSDKVIKALQQPLSFAARNLQKQLVNEDPEKVKGFLLDLSTSEDMPKEVRDGAKQLYDTLYPEQTVKP